MGKPATEEATGSLGGEGGTELGMSWGKGNALQSKAPCKDHEFIQQLVSTYYVPDIVPGTGEGTVSRIIMVAREKWPQSYKKLKGHYSPSPPPLFTHITNMY